MATKRFDYNGTPITFDIETSSESGSRIKLPNGAEFTICGIAVRGSAAEFTVRPAGSDAERIIRIPFRRRNRSVQLVSSGRILTFDPPQPERPAGGSAASDGLIVSPTGGTVVDIVVTPGASVVSGGRIAVVEAMKVMTPVDALIAGTVAEIYVARGDRVEERQRIARIVTDEPPSLDSGSDEDQ